MRTRSAWRGVVGGGAGVLAVVAAGLVGCAATVTPRPDAPVGGGLGRASEAVFGSPELAAAFAVDVGGPEFARRDADLNPRADTPLLATAQWPEPARPTLARRRSVTIFSSPSTFIYFLPPDSSTLRRDFYGGGYR